MIPAEILILTIALVTAIISGTLLCIPTRKVGGLTFWRIGRLGGSIYIQRR